MHAIALDGSMSAGTVCTSPTVPARARASRLGVLAASSVVSPPKSSHGQPDAPSMITITYFTRPPRARSSRVIITGECYSPRDLEAPGVQAEMRIPRPKRLPHLTPGIVIAVAGLALLIAGSALGFAVAFTHGTPPATTTPSLTVADAALGDTGQGADITAAVASPAAAPNGPYIEGVTPPTTIRAEGTQTSVPGTTSTTEPFWRTKQREAEAEQEAAQLIAGLNGTQTVVPPITPVTTPPSTTAPGVRTVGGGGGTRLQGVWSGTADELARYLTANNPSPRFTVPTPTLAQLYVKYAAEAGLRADVLWGQMIHETGWGSYGGDVGSLQNNFAGIGATGGGARGYNFPTAEDGVKAHVAHMVAYVYLVSPVTWANELVDPRYNAVNPRGVARVLSDLDGRWAVPGVGYGATIDRHVAALNL